MAYLLATPHTFWKGAPRGTVMGHMHLLLGEGTEVIGDQAYQGHAEVIRQRAPRAVDRTNRRQPKRTKRLHTRS